MKFPAKIPCGKLIFFPQGIFNNSEKMLKMQHCLFALFSGLAIKEFLSVDNSRIKKDAGDGT